MVVLLSLPLVLLLSLLLVLLLPSLLFVQLLSIVIVILLFMLLVLLLLLLHLLLPTLIHNSYCSHSCHYCTASRQKDISKYTSTLQPVGNRKLVYLLSLSISSRRHANRKTVSPAKQTKVLLSDR
jgi:hypothetical protein